MKNKKKLSKAAKITICAVSGLSVATSIIVPTAVILAKNNPDENIVTIDYNIKGLESGTVKVKAETKVKDLQLEPIEGYAFKGWYKDEACTIRYNLDEVVTHNSTIFAKLEVITYAVIFPTSEFFTVSQTSAIVNYGEDLSFTITKAEGFEQSEETVLANGVTLTAVDGVYTIENITSNITVAIDGITASFARANINISGETQQIRLNIGETLQQALDAANLGITDQNSCGWYTDEACTQVADLSMVIEDTSTISLYTKRVTDEMLNALSFYEVTSSQKSLFQSSYGVNVDLDTTNSAYYVIDDKENTVDTLSNTEGLTELVIPKECVIDGKTYNVVTGLFDKDSTYSKTIKKITLPSTIKVCIGEVRSTSYYVGTTLYVLEEINIHSNIEEVAQYAFMDYYTLDVDFTNATNLKRIGLHAFEQTNISKFMGHSKLEFIDRYALSYCPSLTEIYLNSDVNCSNAFDDHEAVYDYNKTIKLILGENVTKISEGAFIYSRVSSVTVGKNVTSIESLAFSSCNSLIEVINFSSLDLESAKRTSNYGEIAKYAQKVYNVILPEGEGSVKQDNGVMYFETDTDLIAIKLLDNTITNLVLHEDTTEIGEGAFACCYDLLSITIGKNVATIKEGAFAYCEPIEIINYSQAITFTKGDEESYDGVAGYALGVYNLAEGETKQSGVLIYNNVVYFDDGTDFIALWQMNAATEIVLHDDTTIIEEGAFWGLESITIGSNVKVIKEFAFCSCMDLQTVYYKGTDQSSITIESDNDPLTSIEWTKI